MATEQPPHDNNWYEDTDEEVADQSVGLPKIGSFTLYKITPPLLDPEDLEMWIDEVRKTLRGHNLHNLIDKSIPWPTRDSPNRRKWKALSIQVRTWISSSIDYEVRRSIFDRGVRTVFADELVEQIKDYMEIESYGVLRLAMKSWMKCTRKQYSTNREFINAIRTKYRTLLGLKLGPAPYFAIQKMIMELMEVPDLKSFIVLKDNELDGIKNPVTTITVADFQRYCTSIEQHIKMTNADYASFSSR